MLQLASFLILVVMYTIVCQTRLPEDYPYITAIGYVAIIVLGGYLVYEKWSMCVAEVPRNDPLLTDGVSTDSSGVVPVV